MTAISQSINQSIAATFWSYRALGARLERGVRLFARWDSNATGAYADSGPTLTIGDAEITSADQTEVRVPITLTCNGTISIYALNFILTTGSGNLTPKSIDGTAVGLSSDQMGLEDWGGGMAAAGSVLGEYETADVTSGTIYVTYAVNLLADETVTLSSAEIDDASWNSYFPADSTCTVKNTGESVDVWTVSYTDQYGNAASIKTFGGKTLTVDGVESTITSDITVPAPSDPDPGYSKVGYQGVKDADGNITLTKKSSSPIKYTITYNLPFAATSSNPKTYTVEYSDITLSAPGHVSMVIDGCCFSGSITGIDYAGFDEVDMSGAWAVTNCYVAGESPTAAGAGSCTVTLTVGDLSTECAVMGEPVEVRCMGAGETQAFRKIYFDCAGQARRFMTGGLSPCHESWLTFRASPRFGGGPSSEDLPSFVAKVFNKNAE